MVIDTGINYNLTAGTSVGLQPTYQWNAKVTSVTIQIYDAEGNAVADSYTSEGDHITILSICPSEYTQLSLALIQFSDQSNSCYIQGYIKTSDFNLLECRFNNSWIDTTNNQQIIFANGDLADRTLSTGDYQTYLYATDNYACISFLNDDNAFKSGFVPLSSGNLNIIQTDIPFYLAPWSSVGTEPSYPSNATTIASQIEIVDINGITIPNNYTSNGDNITILDVYMNEKLALIEFIDSYAGTYIIGYIPVENLINGNIKLKTNYCNWNSSTKEYSIYDLQKSVIYKIESSQTTEYLFKTNAYACILFNNNNVSQWPLATLQEYAQQARVSDYNTIQGQIDIIIYQMKYDPGEQYFENYNYPDFWIPANEFVISTKSPSFLAQAWLHNYERAGVACTHSRVEGAEYWYDYFS